MKLLRTLLETLLRCQQPRRRPHLEATKPTQAGANWSSLQTSPPAPPAPAPSTLLARSCSIDFMGLLAVCEINQVLLPPPHHCLSLARKPPMALGVLTTEHVLLCQAFWSWPWNATSPFSLPSSLPRRQPGLWFKPPLFSLTSRPRQMLFPLLHMP